MTVGALDETGQEKQGTATSGVKRQYMGWAGRVANGINTVHLSYVRRRRARADRGTAVDPGEDIADPVKSLVTALPPGLRFRTKGSWRTLTLTACRSNFAAGLGLRRLHRAAEFLEDRGQAYVLRVASSFVFALAPGVKVTCADAVKKLLKGKNG